MKKTLLAMAALALIASCKKKETETPTPVDSSVPTPTGSISGKIKQRNGYGTTYTLSLANLTVSVNGTSKSAVTDAAGAFTITELPAGVYDLSMLGPNDQAFQAQQVSFVGNGNLIQNYEIWHRTNDSLAGRIVDTIVGGKKGISIRLRSKTAPYSIKPGIILFSKTATVDPRKPNSFEHSIYFYTSTNISTADYKFETFLDYNFLAGNTGISSGQQIFVTVLPTGQGGSFKDVYTEKYISFSAGVAMNTTQGFMIP